MKILATALLVFLLTALLPALPAQARDHDSLRARIVSTAKQHLGIPYRWGGTTHGGMDCSGFTQHIFGHVNVFLPHYSHSQARLWFTYRTRWSKLRVGDLLYWRRGHVAIFVGWRNGQRMIAENTGVSRIRPLDRNGNWWNASAIPIKVRFDWYRDGHR